MDDRKRVREYIKRRGIQPPERIRSALSNHKDGPVPTSVIREVLAEVRDPNKPTPPSPTLKSQRDQETKRLKDQGTIKTRTLTEFRSQHDYALKLKRTITDLGEGYLTEHEIKVASGIPNHVWRRYADLPEFQENKLKLRDVTYWARTRVIAEMREIVGAV